MAFSRHFWNSAIIVLRHILLLTRLEMSVIRCLTRSEGGTEFLGTRFQAFSIVGGESFSKRHFWARDGNWNFLHSSTVVSQIFKAIVSATEKTLKNINVALWRQVMNRKTANFRLPCMAQKRRVLRLPNVPLTVTSAFCQGPIGPDGIRGKDGAQVSFLILRIDIFFFNLLKYPWSCKLFYYS